MFSVSFTYINLQQEMSDAKLEKGNSIHMVNMPAYMLFLSWQLILVCFSFSSKATGIAYSQLESIKQYSSIFTGF